MRLTTRTTLALRTLMVCAVNPDTVVRKSDVAAVVNASENHLAQVVNQLGQEGFLTTLRGRNGGFVLARPASEISVGGLFRVFEAELPFLECFGPSNTCPLKGVCRMAAPIARAVEAFYASLDPLTLHDLVVCNDGMAAILTLDDLTRGSARAQCSSRQAVPA